MAGIDTNYKQNERMGTYKDEAILKGLKTNASIQASYTLHIA